ncbi:hypothetical protein ACTXT7_017407 [Hymenolepis weldensis]
METCAAQIPCPDETPIVAQAQEMKVEPTPPAEPCCNLRELMCQFLNCLCTELAAFLESCAESNSSQVIVQSPVKSVMSASDTQQVSAPSTASLKSSQPVMPMPSTKTISTPLKLEERPLLSQQDLPQVVLEPTRSTKSAKATVSTKSVKKPLEMATEPTQIVVPPKPAKSSKSVKSTKKSTKTSVKPSVAKSAVPSTGPELRPCLMRLIQKVDPELAGCLDTCNNSL